MTLYQLTHEARLDLLNATDYIASDNEAASIRWEARMLAAFDRIAEWPASGAVRREFTSRPLRFWVEGNYLIVYDSAELPVSIVAILHGAQSIALLLSERFDATPED